MKLKTWYDVVELREDLRENRPLDASEFAIHLDQIRDGRAHKDYTDPLPWSEETAMNPDDVRDFEAMNKLLGRVGKSIMMSAETEITEIIHRRLFDWHGMPDEARKTAAAYAEWAVEHAQELTGIDADTARDRFLSAYPFHPSVLSVFERKWASLPQFQRTRGVLRLLALWVARNHQEEHRKATGEPLTLGLAPLQDPTFRTALFGQLGSNGLEIPVTTDIIGKTDANATRLDREAGEAVKKAQLHRKVATTLKELGLDDTASLS